MDLISIIIISALASCAVIGLIIGLCKGFSHCPSGGIEYVLVCVGTILLGGLVKSSFKSSADTGIAGVITLGIGIALIIAFSGTSALCRKLFNGSRKKKIASGKKHGSGNGPSGFVDCIFGGFSLAVKGVVVAGVTAAAVLVAVDLAQLGFTDEYFGVIYAGESWSAFKPYIFDCLVLGLIFLAVKHGFNSGISSLLWIFVMFAMVAFAGYASYHLAFNVESFGSLANSVAAVIAGEGEITEQATLIARCIVTAGIFLLTLVVIVPVGIFVPRLLDRARDGRLFFAIDGVGGAVISVAMVAATLLVAGNILQPFCYDLEKYSFIAGFTSYFDKSAVATYFYNKNILTEFGVPPMLPLLDWIG